MPETLGRRPSWNVLRWCLALGLTVGATSAVVTVSAWAQGVDLDDGVHAPKAAAPAPGLDTDVNASQPLSSAAVPAAGSRANIQGGIHVRLQSPDQEPDTASAPQPALAPASETPLVSAMPPADLPEPVNLDHPTVVDTGKLSASDKIVSLFGIVGQSGEPAQQLQSYLASTDGHLTCPAHTSSDYVCMLADGTDVAAVALVNGAARTRDDAPEAYRAQEAEAQANRRGIWAYLPPPPAVLTHPTVRDTATLVSGTQTYVLDGLVGMGPPYTAQLQGYIAANGDKLNCEPQATPGHYICVLNDGADIAKVALVNGAARVGTDAPDSYRLQQLEALDNHRGVWLNPSAQFVMANAAVAQSNACCAFVAGDEGGDGITYVGGEPTAVIDGETVFLVLAGDAGWGYYDHYHHWRGAPGRYRSHMEHFHPNGQGLRAYRGQGAVAHQQGTAGRTAYASAGHPGMGGPVSHPGMATHPGGAAPMGGRPAMGGGGGFVHPAATSAPSFRPAGMSSHASAPVSHASAPPARHK